MRVSLTEMDRPTIRLQGDQDSYTQQSNGGLIVEHQLRIDRNSITDLSYGNLRFRDFRSFSVNGGDYKDYYYMGHDDVAHIFSTRP